MSGRPRVHVLPYALAAAGILAFDLATRGARFSAFRASDALAYAATLVESTLLWGSLFWLARAGRPAVRVVAGTAAILLGAWLVGGQRYFFQSYGTYVNRDAIAFGASFGKSLHGQVRADLAAFVGAHLLGAGLVFGMLVVSARSRRAPRAPTWLFAALLPPVLLPCSFRRVQAATPDVLYVHGVTGLVTGGAKPPPASERTPVYVPAVEAKPAVPRNVVLILTESVRADDTCEVPGAPCTKATRATHALLPSRLQLRGMRANDSTTAISVAVLFTGLSPTAPKDAIGEAPMLWEYARAAGYSTAYFTSQDLRFANSDMFIRNVPMDRRISAEQLEPSCDIDVGAHDDLLAAHVEKELGALPEPYFAVLHLSNTHYPYRVDEGDEPFAPHEYTKDPAKNEHFHNHFRNAVHAQDKVTARLVRAVRARPGGDRTVVLFTSDHGESFREHGQLGHTLSVFDEEVRVPTWVDAPEASLTESERRSLASLSDTGTTHVDVAPTLLDLLGILDDPALARWTATLPGKSLLRAPEPERDAPVTNCNALWTCPFRNWGIVRGSKKLEAREWDAGWHCFDLAKDPREEKDLGAAACGDMALAAEKLLGGHPGKAR